MDAALAALVGAAIGAVASLGGAWIQQHYQTRRERTKISADLGLAEHNCDVELAKRVVTTDNVVDGLYDQVFRELITFMMVDPKTSDRATRLIWAAHNLERVADRATNICERAVFAVTGKMEETAD